MLVPRTLGLAIALIAVALPLLEVAVMIKVGSAIGFWPAMTIIMSTAVLGMWVLQTHGFVMMRRFSQTLEAGRPPLEPMIEGVLLFLAAILLISPGFICDAVGFVLLIPPVRQGIAKLAHDRLWGAPAEDVRAARPQADPSEEENDIAEREARRARGAGPIIEGEFERVDDPPRKGREKR